MAERLVDVTSGHRGEIGFGDSAPTLTIFRGGIPYLGISVAKLVASAFNGVGLERIESVQHLDGDPANCSKENLTLVEVKDATTDGAIAARHKAAREEGHKAAWKAVYCDEDYNLFQYEMIVTFS